MLKTALSTILRFTALTILFLVLFMLATSLTTPPEMAARLTPEQAAASMAVMPLVALLMTGILTYLALRSRWYGWKLAGALFVIFYGIYTFLSQIETAAFHAVAGRMTGETLAGFFLAGLILCLPFSLLAVWILGKARKGAPPEEQNLRLHMPASEWAWKLAAAVVLYEAVYFTFGYFVAWRNPAVPLYYGGTDPGTFVRQMSNVMRDTPWLPAFQAFRALIWSGIGLIIIRMHKGKVWETTLATGLAFAILMAAPLLFPNPIMPEAVTRAHMIELLSSNFTFGILLTVLMIWHPAASSRVKQERRSS